MNERAKALVNAPGSVAPQTELTSARDINQAVKRNFQGRNYGVYCQDAGEKPETYRVLQARTQKGQLQVKTFHGWKTPRRVWKEG